MRRTALWLGLLAGCGAPEPEGVRWLCSRGASYELDPPAKLHVVSGFPTDDGVKIAGKETVVFCALVRYAEGGGRRKTSTEHGDTDTTFTHRWGGRSLSYAWDRKEDVLRAEGRIFHLSKGRLFVFTQRADGAWAPSQVERTLEDVTPAIFDDGSGGDALLEAFRDALEADAPAYGFAN